MAAITRQHQIVSSLPTFLIGHCPNCAFAIWLDGSVVYTENGPTICSQCGRTYGRHDWVAKALQDVDLAAWGFLASDFVAFDNFQMNYGDWVTYTVDQPVTKWLYAEVLPRPGADRYLRTINAWEDFVMVTVEDTTPLEPHDDPQVVPMTWYRFGLRDLRVVPAWRQSMFAAAQMIWNNPAAAVVLIAAGFEAYFIETMRINWQERGYRPNAFGKIRKQPISALIDWLPGAVGLQSLADSSDNLQSSWNTLINERRNDVVHRADVHVTTEQAMESLACALKCIHFIDALGLIRPHTYFAGE